MMGIRYKILKTLLNIPFYDITQLYKYYTTRKEYNKSYSTFYNIIKELKEKEYIKKYDFGYITTEKGKALLDNTTCKTSTKKTNYKKYDKKNYYLKKMYEIVNNNKNFDYNTEEGKKNRYSLNSLFINYIKEVINKIIVLKKEYDTGHYEYIKIPYTTRFTSKKIILKNLRTFEKNFYQLQENENKAVFLTLTTDLKKFDNLSSACENLAKSFKKFMDWLNRNYKRKYNIKLKYISCFEFSPKKAIPHLHIIIFGINTILYNKSIYKISEMWEKYGQGKIVYAYGLKKNNNNEWIYKDSRKKPKDAKTNNVMDYLKKYLIKSYYKIKKIVNSISYIENMLYGQIKEKNKYLKIKKELYKDVYKNIGMLPFYLATGKKLFTNSKIPKKIKKRIIKNYKYVYIGCFNIDNIPKYIEFDILLQKKENKYIFDDIHKGIELIT